MQIESVEELADGESYVCASTDAFKAIDYLAAREPVWNYSHPKSALTFSSLIRPRSVLAVLRPSRVADSQLSLDKVEASEARQARLREFVRPRIITIIRHGVRPRRVVRLLLNRSHSPSLPAPSRLPHPLSPSPSPAGRRRRRSAKSSRTSRRPSNSTREPSAKYSPSRAAKLDSPNEEDLYNGAKRR